jgi:hypothetical protein
MRFLRQAFICIALCGSAGGAAAAPAANSAFLSFAELYRLTVNGVAVVEFSAAPGQLPGQAPAQLQDFQLRTVSAAQQPGTPAFAVSASPESVPAGYSFSSALLPEPSRWLLILSGLALAAWVARRRLGYSL